MTLDLMLPLYSLNFLKGLSGDFEMSMFSVSSTSVSLACKNLFANYRNSHFHKILLFCEISLT